MYIWKILYMIYFIAPKNFKEKGGAKFNHEIFKK